MWILGLKKVKFPFNLIGKMTTAFFNRPIMLHTQILVSRWGPKQRFSR